MKNWLKKLDENHLSVAFVVISIAALFLIVSYSPEIGVAPLESFGQRILRLAIFTAYWPLALHFLGGRDFNIIKMARDENHLVFLGTLLASIIIGAALVLGK